VASEPDLKPARRVVDPTAGVEKIRREGRCRACGRAGLPIKDGGVLNRAHLVGKGQRGDDVDANIVPLCGSGTEGCHGAFDGGIPKATVPSLLPGFTTAEIRAIVRSKLTIEELNYATDKKGAWWLQERF
jgi:hypothetical protein